MTKEFMFQSISGGISVMNFHEGIKTEQIEREEQLQKETWILLCILRK